jgi:hypothetical protein
MTRGRAEEYTVTEATGTEEHAVLYLEDTPMGVALESIAVVLILLIVITSTLLACPVYPFIWLFRKSMLLAARHKSPFSSGSITSGFRAARRLSTREMGESRLADTLAGRPS